MTRERPILMSGPMVRAILAGTKTQTRRVLRGFCPPSAPEYDSETGRLEWFNGDEVVAGMRCPYGQPGDRLWVREKWSPDPPIDGTWASTQWSGCGRRISEVPDRFRHPRFCCYAADWLHGQIVWRPSIHMPRWASRITLEVTGVRVERLQDISEADAKAEGASYHDGRGVGHSGWRHDYGDVHANARSAYARLWESLNGAGWHANPWVWVIEFRREA